MVLIISVNITYRHCTFSSVNFVFIWTTYSRHLYEWYSYVSIYSGSFSPSIGHLGCFHFPIILDIVVMSILILVPFTPNQLFLKKHIHKRICKLVSNYTFHYVTVFPLNRETSHFINLVSFNLISKRYIFGGFSLITKKVQFTEHFSRSIFIAQFSIKSGSLEAALEMRVLV